MSIDRFNACLAITLGYEGGFSDDPDDPGGATNLGIELKGDWWPWQDSKGKTRSTLEQFRDDLTRDDVAPLYLADYWMAVNDGTLLGPVDMVAFDCCVNEGVGKAKEFLSASEGAPDPITRALDMQQMRHSHYTAIVANNPSMAKFLPGWLNRINDLTAKIRNGEI
jgi:lysozyme family protein